MFSFIMPLLEVIKVVIASVASVVFLGFAGLTLAGSAVALIVSIPLFIIFSPILVPAAIATTLLANGLTAGAALGVTAIGLIISLIKAAPLDLLKFYGGYGGSFGGKTFSGTFGNKPGGAAPAGGTTPEIPEWLKNMPWFKRISAGGAIPAAGGAPAAGPEPAAGGAPAGGAEPAAGGTPTE